MLNVVSRNYYFLPANFNGLGLGLTLGFAYFIHVVIPFCAIAGRCLTG